MKIGDQTGENYYSKSDVAIHPKWEYDSHYEAITSRGLFRDEEPGSIIKIDGQPYVLSENYTLDVPLSTPDKN